MPAFQKNMINYFAHKKSPDLYRDSPIWLMIFYAKAFCFTTILTFSIT